MRKHHSTLALGAAAACILLAAAEAPARIKLVALPDRAAIRIRLDNPAATLIEEERALTLQQGVNQIDFSWRGVSIAPDSIRLAVLSHPDAVKLLNVGYPPAESALVWEIFSPEPCEARVRISYLLSFIDRLVTYRALVNKEETHAELMSHLVLRNFSGEDLASALVLLDYGAAVEQDILNEETKQVLFFRKEKVPIEKVWTFDAAELPWDPQRLDGNVGIPVSYKLRNEAKSGLGEHALWGGKMRVYQHDGRGSSIILGEDYTELVPVGGEPMEIRIGDSRDIVVTQHKMREEMINPRRNNSDQVVLFDTDEIIKAKIENFRDGPAVLTMRQHIPGQWEMKECNMPYERKDMEMIEFRIELEKGQTRELVMNYQRKNVRPDQPVAPMLPRPRR